ncbi:DUF6941 family protein [Gemmatimonadota bacterium]
MKLSVAVLADHANVAAGEKLNVFGVFDTIATEEFPSIIPFMVLALRICIEYEDQEKTHKFRISLRDEDGKEYMEANATLTVMKIPAGEVMHKNLILNFAGLQIGKKGRYAFHITANDKLLDRIDLRVIEGRPDKQQSS